MCKMPLLKANEVELRVQNSGFTNGKGWANLLVYKDARTDMRVLDSMFGCMGWKREHKMIGERFACVVSVWDDTKKEWVSKEDVGTESKAEAEKGQASDAFKRACTNWGIGRELYASPTIFISLSADDVDKNGRVKPKLFSMAEMEYDEQRGEFKTMVIVDNKGMVRFDYRNYKQQFLREPYKYSSTYNANIVNTQSEEKNPLKFREQGNVRLYADGKIEVKNSQGKYASLSDLTKKTDVLKWMLGNAAYQMAHGQIKEMLGVA